MLPTEDEWFKAAYHDASKGIAGNYFDYATGSDTVPVSDQPSDNPSAVNYHNDDRVDNGFNDGYVVYGKTGFRQAFTDVGVYVTAESPYGIFDQNGNVMEWSETIYDVSNRVIRGGSWFTNSFSLSSAARSLFSPQPGLMTVTVFEWLVFQSQVLYCSPLWQA